METFHLDKCPHIECSAMNYKQFGEHFDIHGGSVSVNGKAVNVVL